jgi:hypothetical protein
VIPPRDLLGLPAPERLLDEAVLRWVMLLGALALAWLAVRVSGRAAALAALALCAVPVLYWIAALGRPFGLLEDADATRRLALVAVRSQAPGAVSWLAKDPLPPWGLAALMPPGPIDTLVALPSFAPLVALLGVALVLLASVPSSRAPLAAVLWLAAGSGGLDWLRGGGLLPGAWRQPEAAFLLPASVAMLALAGRLPRAPAALLAAVGAGLMALAPAGEPLGPLEALLLLTVDQGFWSGPLIGRLLPRVRAALPRPDRGGLWLAAVGAGLVVAASAGAPVNLWGGAMLFRCGLLLLAAHDLPALVPRLAGFWERAPLVADPARVALVLSLAFLLPGGVLAWWDPARGDAQFRASSEAVTPAYAPLVRFIRDQTPPGSVFIASADYAPVVATLGGRPVLRAPSLGEASDDPLRRRVEGAILGGRRYPPAAPDYGVRYVVVGLGDFAARGIRRPEDLEGRAGLVRRYADARGYRVYEVVR